MTEEDHATVSCNSQKNINEQTTIESDLEDDDDDEEQQSVDSNVTTDDEFYNELMSAPPIERKEYLIPDECNDEIIGIEHLTTCLHRRYNSCPVVFTGTLKDAINEAFHSKEVRPLLIYINNDKSIYSNLFCQQLLCHEKIVDYLLNNYVLWAWDVTFPSNGKKLNEMYKTAFSQWNVDEQIGTKSPEQYPFLLGISHHINGDYLFKYLISGSSNQPIMDEFLGRLIEHKDLFDDGEENLGREKSRQSRTNTSFETPMSHHPPSKYFPNYDFNRSASIFSSSNSSQFARFLSSDNNSLARHAGPFLPFAFQQMNIQPDDDEGDDEDDDDDDDGQTPTVNHPPPNFPQG